VAARRRTVPEDRRARMTRRVRATSRGQTLGRPFFAVAFGCALLAVAACSRTPPPLPPSSGEGPEAISLTGQPLFRPALSAEATSTLQRNLAEAQAAYDAAPQDADAIIWLGRRLAYLGRYRDAIAVFGRGIALHPAEPRLYRHRGHRYITVRELDAAVRDLERAAALVRGRPVEVEPDGAPNAHGIPRSTLQSNIWYHLALAHYLKGDFNRALPAWIQALEVSNNDDMLVATSDWLYMTYRRLGREAEAAAVLEPIHRDMEILENTAYHRRLLMYEGEIPPDSLLRVDTADPVQLATYGYGVGNWMLYSGERTAAFDVFRRILANTNWAAFGYIAAEAELARATR
jgi:tetratricopeptide (TPR) repeat protein